MPIVAILDAPRLPKWTNGLFSAASGGPSAEMTNRKARKRHRPLASFVKEALSPGGDGRESCDAPAVAPGPDAGAGLAGDRPGGRLRPRRGDRQPARGHPD